MFKRRMARRRRRAKRLISFVGPCTNLPWEQFTICRCDARVWTDDYDRCPSHHYDDHLECLFYKPKESKGPKDHLTIRQLVGLFLLNIGSCASSIQIRVVACWPSWARFPCCLIIYLNFRDNLFFVHSFSRVLLLFLPLLVSEHWGGKGTSCRLLLLGRSVGRLVGCEPYQVYKYLIPISQHTYTDKSQSARRRRRWTARIQSIPARSLASWVAGDSQQWVPSASRGVSVCGPSGTTVPSWNNDKWCRQCVCTSICVLSPPCSFFLVGWLKLTLSCLLSISQFLLHSTIVLCRVGGPVKLLSNNWEKGIQEGSHLHWEQGANKVSVACSVGGHGPTDWIDPCIIHALDSTGH